MTAAQHNAAVLAAHRAYADALRAVDIASAELATAREFLNEAEGRLRQLARVDEHEEERDV